MSNNPPERIHNDLLESLASSLLRSDIRAQLQQNALSRRNTPSRWKKHLGLFGTPSGQGRLWIVDRVLEPQTIVHFVSFMAGCMDLPGGAQTELPLLETDAQLLMQPLSAWAPSPYDAPDEPLMGKLMARIGSFQEKANLQRISKTLIDMKSRLWDGHAPISDRRWAERRLSEPQNFSAACQIIVNVLSVFHYLNLDEVRNALRRTYNFIWDHLKDFEDALNARRRLKSLDPVSPTALWAEYMRAHFARMEASAHAWLLKRLNELKEVVLHELADHNPMGMDYDQQQLILLDMWQDITENLSHADYAIFIPMDGYKGCPSVSATNRPCAGPGVYSGTTPLRVSTSINQRLRDYHLRRRQINLMSLLGGPALGPPNSPAQLVGTCCKQEEAQDKTREELRGPTSSSTPTVLGEIGENATWGFIAYRGCFSHTHAEWADFKAKFEADIGDWGKELGDISSLRGRSKIHWLDPNELGLTGTDVDTLRQHFNDFQEAADFPENVITSVFLLADEASMNSYLTPISDHPTLGLVGDCGSFIVAVDSGYDANEPNDREDESPGYTGTLRILGSLLWDDLCAMLQKQTQFLEDLWPLAMYHPFGVYVGPVGQRQSLTWRALRMIRNDFVLSFLKWRESQTRGS